MTQDEIIEMAWDSGAYTHRITTWGFSLENLERFVAAIAAKALAQRIWVDLTRTQMQDVYFKVLEEHLGGHQMVGQLAFGEALQAKIREKNT
jgi:hypothetical protein